MHFNKIMLLSLLFMALLTACGGQNTTDTASSSVKQTPQSLQTASIALSPSDLLNNLAMAYPNGEIPIKDATQAAKELGQNPAVLRETAVSASIEQKTKITAIQPQAVSTDYKVVTRIQNTSLTGAYFFTIYETERDAALANNPNWKLEGIAFIASIAPDGSLSLVHRFRNKFNGSYLYTIYESEKTDITANYASTFVYEGIAWYAQQTPSAGWSPLYRFRNLLNGTYLFSAYEEEKIAIEANYSALFKLEGVAYYVTLPCKAAATGATGYSLVFKDCDTANTATYYDKTECVRDNATGLIWQGQTTAGTGLRGNDQYKTNFDSTVGNQNWNNNNPIPATQVQIDAVTNTVGFKNAVNATKLCGSGNWRLPTVAEVESISSSSSNNIWFPNTQFTFYWTSSPYADANGASYSGTPMAAWMVNMSGSYRQPGLRGHGNGRYGYDFYSVRLVR